MKKWVDDSFETYEGKISEFLCKKPEPNRRMIFIAVMSLVLVAVIFFAATVQGRVLATTGAAVVMKSFHDALGLPVRNSVVQEITDAANVNPAAGDDTTASISDVVASGTENEGDSFPSVLPTPPIKTKKSPPTKASVKTSQTVGVPDVSDVPPVSIVSASNVGVSTVAKSTSAINISPHVNPGTVYPVSVAFQGDGRGMVTSTPSGISCDGAGMCTWNFDGGSAVTFHATHDTMSSFGGWSGVCSGATAACTFTVDGTASITAVFHTKANVVASGGTSATPSVALSVVVATSTAGTDVVDIASTTVMATSSSDLLAAGFGGDTSTDGGVPSAVAASHILIAAVQIAGDATSNDFVKLYNPTAVAIDVSGWKLHKKSNTGADYSLKVFASGTSMPAGGYLVWANSANGFSDAIGADVASTQTLAADNSVALFDASGSEIDAVAWGNGTDQYVEGSPYPANPGANQVLARRSVNGGEIDTDDNGNDFALQ